MPSRDLSAGDLCACFQVHSSRVTQKYGTRLAQLIRPHPGRHALETGESFIASPLVAAFQGNRLNRCSHALCVMSGQDRRRLTAILRRQVAKCGILRTWASPAFTHTSALNRLEPLPLWFALFLVLLDFGLVGLSFRYTPVAFLVGWAIYGVIQYCIRLALAAGLLTWACRHYRVSPAVVGIRRFSTDPDLRWSLKVCALCAGLAF